jgi:transposase
MTKKYVITLKAEERERLLGLIGSGTAKARTLTHARILLKADDGWSAPEIGKALDVSTPTIERVRKRFVFEGFEASLKPHRPKRVYSRKLDGEQEARLVTLACSSPPEGYARWSLRLLADWIIQLKIIDSISRETVRQVLDDNELKPWRRQEWCIPAANAEVVYHMEDILDVYKRPVDPKRPLVCFDFHWLRRWCSSKTNSTPIRQIVSMKCLLLSEAKRILERLEFHSTPKHGSWLNMAEIELSVLNRQCLNRCIPNQPILVQETEAWSLQRNNKKATVDWQFTTEDARIKLKRLHPSIHD